MDYAKLRKRVKEKRVQAKVVEKITNSDGVESHGFVWDETTNPARKETGGYHIRTYATN